MSRIRGARVGVRSLRRLVAGAGAAALASGLLTVVSVAQAPAAVAASLDFGIASQSFAGFATSTPTAPKPESKLWYAQGSWWADMASTATGGYTIERLDRGSSTWVDTGVALDGRGNTQADVLWNGQHLFVASHVISSSSSTALNNQPARLLRYSWTGSGWAPDAGFPVVISTYSAEAMTLAQDQTGRLWTSFTRGKRVYVASTTGSGDAATVAFSAPVIPVLSNLTAADSTLATTLSADDISAVISNVGVTTVVWGNQVNGTYYSARHADGDPATTWTSTMIASGPLMSDDHINLKAVPGDPSGRIYAVLKTSRNDAVPEIMTDPLLLLAVYTPATDTWALMTFATVAESGTRPVVVLEPSTDTLRVLYTGPTPSGVVAYSGTIYQKTTTMSAPTFAAGKGTPVLRDSASATMNNATTAKAPVDGTSGSVVLAATEGTTRYWYSDTLAGTTLPPAPVASFTASTTSGTAPVAVAFTDTSTGALTSWAWNFGDGTSSTSQSPSHTFTSAGTFTVRLTASGPGGSTSATASIVVSAPAAPVASFTSSTTSGTVPVAVAFTDTSSGAPTSWAWDFGDGTSSTSQSPSHTFTSAGTFTVRLTVSGPGGSTSATASIVVSPAVVVPTVIDRVNAGGDALAGGWLADLKATPSTWVNNSTAKTSTGSTTSAINVTDPSVPAGTPAALFTTNRFDNAAGTDMVWSLPVPKAGTYTVRLYFAETYWSAAGKRIFNVSINGTQVLTNFDIVAAAGAAKKGIVKSFTVTTSGPVVVSFGRTAADNPAVSGLEVLSQ